MKLQDIKVTTISGTNCGNCSWTHGAKNELIGDSTLNEQGGLTITNKDDLAKAKAGDLITLPGIPSKQPKSKMMCQHKGISMYVTSRMCCAYWDNPGCIRDFK